MGRVPAEPARAGAGKLARPFPTPALLAPAGLGSSPRPQRLNSCPHKCWRPRLRALVPVPHGCPQETPRHFGGSTSKLGMRKGGITPGTNPTDLLPRALLPSPSTCRPAGLQGSPPCCHRAPQVEGAEAPGADAADVEDRQVGDGPGWARAAPAPSGSAAVPHPPCCSPEPTAWSCTLVPVLNNATPKGSLGPSPLPAASRREASGPAGGTGRGLAGGTALAAAGLCDMPVPLCSVQLAKDGSRAEQSPKYMQDPHAPV